MNLKTLEKNIYDMVAAAREGGSVQAWVFAIKNEFIAMWRTIAENHGIQEELCGELMEADSEICTLCKALNLHHDDCRECKGRNSRLAAILKVQEIKPKEEQGLLTWDGSEPGENRLLEYDPDPEKKGA